MVFTNFKAEEIFPGMKKIIFILMILISLFGIMGGKSDSDPASWSEKKISKWFVKSEWSGGWKVSPDPSINKKQFAVSYFKHKDRWDKAFAFFKNNDLSKLEVKRYDIDGDNLFALVSEYLTKNPETTDFEAHRKYIDIQYVISGREIMNIAPLSTLKDLIHPYDDTKDIEFLSVSKLVSCKADQSNFFMFFPEDAHRPGLRDGASAPVRKVVIKLRVE
jgi:YhcH/YjgK/YiaL family protein